MSLNELFQFCAFWVQNILFPYEHHRLQDRYLLENVRIEFQQRVDKLPCMDCISGSKRDDPVVLSMDKVTAFDGDSQGRGELL